jgi:hypothetical protein
MHRPPAFYRVVVLVANGITQLYQFAAVVADARKPRFHPRSYPLRCLVVNIAISDRH